MLQVLETCESKMQKSLESLEKDFSSLRTGRASVSLLDKIRVEYYGDETPINQVATISVPEARMIVIQPWDKSVLSAIEKAILKSDLGLPPN
ncbi:MAG TPA: ribosome recycling factor, partial [Sphaerochaeta sp.]|nr:ribosome recycling factor [Sphaerochaeta sp.]